MKTNMAAPKKKKIVKKKAKTVKRKTAVKRSKPKSKIKAKNKSSIELERSSHNPIIEPNDSEAWESKATFNPTAFEHEGTVHIIYRAIGDTDNSVLGYAMSKNGLSISERFPVPVYSHSPHHHRDKTVPVISYSSGGGWGGGCEDPRLTLLGTQVYMLYTAFDGWGSVRIALTSIPLKDFLSENFIWQKPVLISPPGEIHKNWVLFPKKIKGKYAILHSISPKIMVDYFYSLDELDGHTFIHSVHQGSPLWEYRDRLIRGIGPSPIWTKYGWLAFYHKMEAHDSYRYKLWAMILDANDPTKILYDSNQPILEPDEWYENEGYKSGVVNACGAVVKDGQLFVYYGGADKVSAVATANLDEFLEGLVHAQVRKLTSKKIKA